MIFDGDLSVSQAHFTDDDPSGDHVPGAVETVVSAGVTVDNARHMFGSVRLRYLGPRPLLEGDSVRSKATSLMNAQIGDKLTSAIRISLDVFNIFDAKDSDIDYYYTSRLPGEPLDGINDIHFHPTLPRTARVSLTFGF